MSLYGLEGSIRDLLRLENFESTDFTTKEFIEKLSQSQSHALADDSLDPKPYIRTFEAVASELQRLLEVAASQESESSRSVEQLTESHNYNVVDIFANVEAAAGDVSSLDEHISEITRATQLLGDRLETLYREHRQVSDSRLLVSYYLSFLRKGSSPELEKLWASDESADRKKCAQAVGQLQILARKIGDLPGSPRVGDDIDKFAERLETHLVGIFQDAYSAFDLVGMKEIADILYDFNGGSSVVQAFVNQNDFFMQIDKLEDNAALTDKEMWRKLSDPRSDYPEFEQVLQKLVDEVVEMVSNETGVIVRIFPRPVQVLNVFMQRTFAQTIQGQIMMYTQEAENHTSLTQARVLFVCYEKIASMVKRLKDTWSKLKLDDGELAAMLDSNFTDTFTLFLDDSYFQANEIPLLKEIIGQTFQPFFDARNSESRGAMSQTNNRGSDGLLGRFTSEERAGSDDTADPEEGKLHRLDRFMKAATDKTSTSAMLSRFRGKSASTNVPPDAKSLLQLEDLQLVLAAFAETVGREQVLRPQAEVVRDVVLIFNLLMQDVGGGYVNVSFEDARKMAEQDVKLPINWAFLEAVKRGTSAVQLIAAFVKIVLFPMVRHKESSHSEMTDAINQYVTAVQDSASDVLDQASQLAKSRIQHILRKQKRKDFNPREGELAVTDGPSPAGSEILQMLTDLETQARQSLQGNNLRGFLSDVAMQLHDELLAHIKKQTINKVGGQMLANDTEAYEYTVVTEWELKEVADSFATLRAITQLFTSDSKLLSSLARESHLSRLRVETLNDYASLRADFQSQGLNMTFLHRLQLQY